MKKLLNLFFVLQFFLLVSACSDSEDSASPLESDSSSNLKMTVSDAVHSSQMQKISEGTSQSDPFFLKNASIDTAKQELHIEIAYSGGCAEHDFEVIWPEAVFTIFPPVYPIILNHQGNGDMCEALISETLVIDLLNPDLAFNQFTINNMIVEVINGSNKDEVVRTDEK